MTETAFMPGVGADSSYVPPPGDVEESEAGADRRRLLMIGAAGGVVVVGAAAYFLLFHKSSSDATASTPIHHVLPQSATHHPNAVAGGGKSVGSGASKTPVKPTKLPKVSKHDSIGRNPFKPLVVAPVTGGTDAGNTTVSGNPSSTTSGSSPTGTNPVASPPVVVQPTSPSQGGAPTAGTPTYVQLLSTKDDKQAVFRVGYAHHTFRKFAVKAPKSSSQTGTIFDKEFALIGIQDGSVTIQVGDATPFDMSSGTAYPV